MKIRKAELSLSDLAVLLGVLGFLCLVASHYFQTANPWFSSLAQNLGSSFVFAVLALVVIDKIVRDYQQRQVHARWAKVQRHVEHYVGNVARYPVLSYRMAMGIGDAEVMAVTSREDSFAVQNTKMADWIEAVLIPQLPRLWALSREDWAVLHTNLAQDKYEAREVLLLYPTLMNAEMHLEVIEIRRGIDRAHQNAELYGSLLGGPHERPYVEPDMRVFALYERTRQKGMTHDAALWWCRLYLGNDATKEATDVLQSSARLLRLLADSYSQGDPPKTNAATSGTEAGRASALPTGDR